jgi:hypothetical protein
LVSNFGEPEKGSTLPLKCFICYNITHKLAVMGLEDDVNERISFLKEQVNPNNRPIENETLQLQIDVPAFTKESQSEPYHFRNPASLLS